MWLSSLQHQRHWQVWSFCKGWGDLWALCVCVFRNVVEWNYSVHKCGVLVKDGETCGWSGSFHVFRGLSLDMNDEETDGWWLCGFPEVLLNEILHRVPAMEDAEVRQLINGPETFTPDSSWLLGETAEVCGFWLQTPVNLVCSSSLLFGQWCLMFGEQDSSVVRVPDLWLKSHGFKSMQERRENFPLRGPTFCADSYFSICSTPVLLQ